ncbi:MAG: SDR family NAD(P)-dependent oxidoreductase [Kiloniellales bacterium]|jgi:NAD(P)-dependent dehydrogenase (short-subunit alcohol dehydrogenase family)|nr:SDR family NAD(P)-dependent oxidoreductase [Kiloniellales bacterium]
MTTDSLAGRKALVVGASGGMGLAVARALAAEGVSCALMARDEARAKQAAAACAEAGTPAFPVLCDIGRTDGLEAAVGGATAKLGGLNFLVFCPGVHVTAKAQEADLAAFDQMLDINFRAFYHLARHALPEINKAPGGAVVAIGSITVAYVGAGMHLAGKRALDGYAEALFEDVRDYGTKVSVIRPGFVNTPMVRSDRLDQRLMIQPEDIARTVLFVLAMPETACPTEITIRPQRTPYRKV